MKVLLIDGPRKGDIVELPETQTMFYVPFPVDTLCPSLETVAYQITPVNLFGRRIVVGSITYDTVLRDFVAFDLLVSDKVKELIR